MTKQELNELLQQEKIERFIDQLEYWGDLTDNKKENEELKNKIEKIKNILENTERKDIIWIKKHWAITDG